MSSYYQQLKETVGELAARDHMRQLQAMRKKVVSPFSDPAAARAAQIKAVKARKKNREQKAREEAR